MPSYITICTTLRGQIKGKSRDTTKIYPWKEGYIWKVSWESYANNWWITLWSKGIAIPTHNAMSHSYSQGFIYKVVPEYSRWM